MKRNLIIGGGILLGLGLFSYAIYHYIQVQTKLLENYKYQIKDIRLNRFKQDEINGEIDIAFTSESDIEVVIKEFALKFFFNGREVGFLQDVKELVIPARASSLITLNFTLDPQKVFSNIADIISYSLSQKDADLSVSGYAKIQSGFISVGIPIQFDTSINQIMA
jgi:hypothetical protein